MESYEDHALPWTTSPLKAHKPRRGSAAHIMFLASNICWVSSGTVSARYCWEPRDVSGEKPTMKKWSLGNGMRLTANLRRSAFRHNRHGCLSCEMDKKRYKDFGWGIPPSDT